MVRKVKNKIVLRPKKITDSQYSHRALKGILYRRSDTMPVPIVTANQDGEKLRTILRQPT